MGARPYDIVESLSSEKRKEKKSQSGESNFFALPFFLFNDHLKLIDDNARQAYGIIVTLAEFIEGFDSDSKINNFNCMLLYRHTQFFFSFAIFGEFLAFRLVD